MLSWGFSSRGEAPLAPRLSRRPEESAWKMATAAGCCGNIIVTLLLTLHTPTGRTDCSADTLTGKQLHNTRVLF